MSTQDANEIVYTYLVLTVQWTQVYRKVACISMLLASVALTLSVIPQSYRVLYISDYWKAVYGWFLFNPVVHCCSERHLEVALQDHIEEKTSQETELWAVHLDINLVLEGQ